MTNIVHNMDCMEGMKALPDNSVDSIVTDPPYGLSFMGKKWDYDVPSVEIWEECLRVLKPGGYLLAFAGTRTQHRMAVRIEDAGFEIRDMIFWCYGSGFPKSLNIGKAINKIDGVEFNEIPASGVGFMNAEGEGGYNVTKNRLIQKGESSDRAKEWEGWGTALKPALEPITVARKPLSEKTVAENCLKWGTGGINVDGCRITSGIEITERISKGGNKNKSNAMNDLGEVVYEGNSLGRFPANLIHDGSDEVMGLFPETKSVAGKQRTANINNQTRLNNSNQTQVNCEYTDSGSAARFFYCAKSSKSERGKGNNHPTVKPIKLMQYLIRLVTPPNGITLDPFAGSGTSALAAMNENVRYICIEKDESSVEIMKDRIKNHESQLTIQF
jgi:DNA modification methylase